MLKFYLVKRLYFQILNVVCSGSLDLFDFKYIGVAIILGFQGHIAS